MRVRLFSVFTYSSWGYSAVSVVCYILMVKSQDDDVVYSRWRDTPEMIHAQAFVVLALAGLILALLACVLAKKADGVRRTRGYYPLLVALLLLCLTFSIAPNPRVGAGSVRGAEKGAER
jgi:MFS-type transporter involved in bile tolerance (Atg22 family)